MRIEKRNGFSIMELMIAAVVLVVLSSVAVAGYQGYRDRAAMLVDETNQKVLAAAVKLYAYDNSALPASLSQLHPEHLGRAYARVIEGKRPYTVLAFLQEWVTVGVAEATVLPSRYYGGDNRILHCILDTSGDTSSYVINPALQGISLSAFLALDGSVVMITEAGDAPHEVSTTVGGSQQRRRRQCETVTSGGQDNQGNENDGRGKYEGLGSRKR